MKKTTLLMAGLVVAAMTLTACSSTRTETAPAPASSETTQATPMNSGTPMASTAPSTTDTAGAVKDEKGVKVVEVEAGSFYYKPNVIKVKKGDKVKVILKSVSMMHDFVIDELKVKAPITKSGSTATVEFVADKVGKFEYYCSVGQHRANGQVGTLIVE